MYTPREIGLCMVCKCGFDMEELVVNFGVCDSCFEDYCPCNENRPNSCPLHPWPDVVLSFEKNRPPLNGDGL